MGIEDSGTKGGTKVIRPKLLIVTSQYTIQQCFYLDDKKIESMERRCVVIEKELGYLIEWDKKKFNLTSIRRRNVFRFRIKTNKLFI